MALHVPDEKDGRPSGGLLHQPVEGGKAEAVPRRVERFIPVVNVIKLYFPLPTKRQNKLDHFSLAILFRLV